MRIVVTGGAGFIGSHLCEHLIKKGNEVICIDNLITGNMKNIETLSSNKKFVFILYDVTKYINVEGPVDYVVHMASPASPVDYLKLKIQTLKVGSLGTHNTLGLARAKNAKYLLASTSEIYGDPIEHPQREEYFGNVNTIGERGVYDEAKRFAEALVMAYHRTHKIDTKIARIFNTYGPRMRLEDGRVLPQFISQALRGEPLTVYGNGSQTRSFCYISDMIEGIYALMMSKENMPVNIGNPEEISILEFAREIIELTGSKSTIEFRELPEGDPKRRRPDITKAKTLLGWSPKVLRREGIKLTIGYFKQVLVQST
jgi:dTDP-glucose 4,6-dehydratase